MRGVRIWSETLVSRSRITAGCPTLIKHASGLTERRERRRAKKAIMEPKQSSSVHSSDNQKDDKAKRRENSKKTKNKGVNVAAGLALMHGFSAQNIGSSRLTVCNQGPNVAAQLRPFPAQTVIWGVPEGQSISQDQGSKETE